VLLPFIGFHFMLIVFGAIISATALVDPHHKRSAPRVGFTLFLAPLSALLLPVGLGLLAEYTLPRLEEVAVIGGYFLGLIGGACLGVWLGSRHKWHLINSNPEADDDDDFDGG
jgi:hypothetical protein